LITCRSYGGPRPLPSFPTRRSSDLTAALNPAVLRCDDRKMTRSEQMFRWELNQDAMATEKLAEGIRKFHEDEVRLQAILKSLIRSEEHTSELQSRENLVCRLLLEKK